MALPGFFPTMPGMVSMIPVIFWWLQVIFHLIFIWFFGTLSMRGYRRHGSALPGMFLTALAGMLCLFAGIAFAGFVPYFSQGFYHLMQIDLVVAGLVLATVLAIALWLLTHKYEKLDAGDLVEALKRKVLVLEEKLASKAHQISKADARAIAEHALPNYTFSSARLVGHEWEVEMRHDERVGKVMIDAWDGEVKSKRTPSDMLGVLKDASQLAGLLIIIAMVAGTLVFFEGFEDPSENFAAIFGISLEQLANMTESLQYNPFLPDNTPAGCVSPSVFIKYNDQLEDGDWLLDHAYDDNRTKSDLERQAQDQVILMVRLDDEGKEIVMAFTENKKACYLTDGNFCGCIDSQA